MNKLIVLSGMPGSGKSYISALIKQKRPNGHVYVVSSDHLREVIGASQINFTNEELMWKMYFEIAKAYALDKEGIVILDSTNIKRIHRIDNNKVLKPLFDEVDMVMFKLSKDVIEKQNVNRPYPVPKEAMDRMFEGFEDINEEDIKFFDNVYVIENNSINEVVDKLLK